MSIEFDWPAGVSCRTAKKRARQPRNVEGAGNGCSSCHGYSAHGGVGPRLATTSLSMDALMKYVRQPSGVMPRYATQSQITDATLADIYAFLKSVPPPPDPKTIPLLQIN